MNAKRATATLVATAALVAAVATSSTTSGHDVPGCKGDELGAGITVASVTAALCIHIEGDGARVAFDG